jgi:uncharacterized protein YjiS (DUF1127 family)
MDPSRQAILVAGLTALAGMRSYSQSDSRRRIRGPLWGTRFWRWCARCSALSRQRAALSELEERLLEDIGVTRQQANAEATKPFWR